MFIHKQCWEFGHCCAIEYFNNQSVTIATAGVEVSETAELKQARMTVEVRDIATQKKTDSVEGSMQTELLDQCDACVDADGISRPV